MDQVQDTSALLKDYECILQQLRTKETAAFSQLRSLVIHRGIPDEKVAFSALPFLTSLALSPYVTRKNLGRTLRN